MTTIYPAGDMDYGPLLKLGEEVVDSARVFEEMTNHLMSQSDMEEFMLLWSGINRPDHDEICMKDITGSWKCYDLHEIRCVLNTSQPRIVKSRCFREYVGMAV